MLIPKMRVRNFVAKMAVFLVRAERGRAQCAPFSSDEVDGDGAVVMAFRFSRVVKIGAQLNQL